MEKAFIKFLKEKNLWEQYKQDCHPSKTAMEQVFKASPANFISVGLSDRAANEEIWKETNIEWKMIADELEEQARRNDLMNYFNSLENE